MLESVGASIPQISQALGQSPESKCTAVYIHAFEGDLEKAISVLIGKQYDWLPKSCLFQNSCYH